MSATTLPAALIAEAALQGIRLVAAGERLRIIGPDAARARWRDTLTAHKPALLAYLNQSQNSPGPHPVGDLTAAVITDIVTAIATGKAPDDRATCQQCQHLDYKNQCRQWPRLDAPRGYQPVVDVPRRCPAYQSNGKAAPEEGNHVSPASNNCHACPHWGEVNHQGKGECAAGFRPWRVSNVAGTPDHYRWHYVGPCAKEIER